MHKAWRSHGFMTKFISIGRRLEIPPTKVTSSSSVRWAFIYLLQRNETSSATFGSIKRGLVSLLLSPDVGFWLL